MKKEHFNISFYYPPDQLKGTAEVTKEREEDQDIYLVSNICFDNTEEEITESQLLIEEELRIKPVLQEETNYIDWVNADTEEESELARIVGHAIEKYHLPK